MRANRKNGFRSDSRSNNSIPNDLSSLLKLVEVHGSITKAAAYLGVARTTLQHRFHRLQAEADGPGAATERVVSNDDAEWGDIEKLLQSRGLNLEGDNPAWLVRGARVNEWGDGNRQLRVDLSPAMMIPQPAVLPSGWQPVKPAKGKKTTTGLVAFLSDQHAPHHDERLHRAVVAWLAEYQPERIILLGDLLDYDSVSRHKPNPEFSATLQDTINAGHQLLCDYRTAAPGAKIEALDGNHEDRLRNAILQQVPALHGLKPANSPDLPELMSTRSLLRLDELGVTFHRSPYGAYDSAQIEITSNLAARHGWIAKKGSGASALATIDHLRYSVVVGHTHRQSLVYHTAHSITGKPQRLLGCEAGTLAKIEGGLGYANAPDWQQGWATATVHGDDSFSVDLAVYAGGRALWRDWIYDTREEV